MQILNLVNLTMRSARAGLPLLLVLIMVSAIGFWVLLNAGLHWSVNLLLGSVQIALAGLSVRAMQPDGARPAVAEQWKVLCSVILTGFILFFIAVMTLLALVLLVMAIRAGAGYDFEVAEDIAMQTYANSPGRQLELVAAMLAALVYAVGVARSLPVIAASTCERRIIALEAFNWTRGQGTRLLAASLVCVAPFLAIAMTALLQTTPIGGIIAALFAALALHAWAALSLATYQSIRPA